MFLTEQIGKRQVVFSRANWDIVDSPIKPEGTYRSYDDLFSPLFPPLIDSFTDLVDDYSYQLGNKPPLWLEVMGTLHLLENLEVPGVAVGLEKGISNGSRVQINSDLLDHANTFSRIEEAFHRIRPTRPYPNFITWKGEGGLMAIPQDPYCFAFYIYQFSTMLDYNGSAYYQVPYRLLEKTKSQLNQTFELGKGFAIYSARGHKGFSPYDGLIRVDRLTN